MKTNQQEDQATIVVPSILRKIQNGTGSECWVTLTNPSLSSSSTGESLPNFAPGEGDICTISNNTVYACSGLSVFQEGTEDPVMSADSGDAFFRTMCQVDDVLYIGSDNGLYYYNTNDGTGGFLSNTSAITSITAVGETLYMVSAQMMYSFTTNTEDPSSGSLNPSTLGFNSEETVFVVGILDQLFIVFSSNEGISVSEYDLDTKEITWDKVITPSLGASISDVLGATGIYSYHNNPNKSNHFLYLVNQDQQVCVTYLESPELNTVLVGSGNTVSAVSASPYDTTGLGQNTFVYGLSTTGDNANALQINPVLNTPIYLALREDMDSQTTVLPNNSFIFDEGDASQSTLDFKSTDETQSNSITVYYSSEPYENYSTRYHQITPEGTYGIDYVAYEQEPDAGYDAMMAILKAPQEGGVVIIGEMDLDPVENDPSAPALH